jgi:hypothetical protein
MENSSIFPKRIDEKVTITMMIVAILSLGLMAYRYSNRTTCASFGLLAKAKHFYTGEVIKFETDIVKYKTLRWNFGDNQHDDTRTSSAVHAYDEPGEYIVSLTADGTCTEYTSIMITAAPKVENPSLLPTFICPQSAEVGKPVQFADTTNGATQWQWRFGESASVDATARNPQYTYTTPGLKTVSIVINNDQRQIGICKIYVNPPAQPEPLKKKETGGGRRPMIVIAEQPQTAPLNEQLNPTAPALQPEPVKAPDVSGVEFETMLRSVANKQKTAQSFSVYLCGNLNVQTSLNGQEITFTELCNKLAGLKSEKKIKRMTVQLMKNERTGCVIALFVTLKEKEGLLNRIF